MKIIVLRRWLEMTRRQRLLTGFAGLLVVVLMGYALWSILAPDAPSSFSGKDSLPVNAPVGDSSIQFTTETVEPIFHGENYFVNYRLQREQSRQEAKSMLSPLLDSSVAKTKEEAQQKWLELSHKIEKEGQVENLLKIKGFKDAVVDVSKNGVNVIIYAPGLTSGEVNLIQDVVLRVTNVKIDQINISFKN